MERPSKKEGFCFKIFNPTEQSIWASRGPEGETIGKELGLFLHDHHIRIWQTMSKPRLFFFFFFPRCRVPTATHVLPNIPRPVPGRRKVLDGRPRAGAPLLFASQTQHERPAAAGWLVVDPVEARSRRPGRARRPAVPQPRRALVPELLGVVERARLERRRHRGVGARRQGLLAAAGAVCAAGRGGPEQGGRGPVGGHDEGERGCQTVHGRRLVRSLGVYLFRSPKTHRWARTAEGEGGWQLRSKTHWLKMVRWSILPVRAWRDNSEQPSYF